MGRPCVSGFPFSILNITHLAAGFKSIYEFDKSEVQFWAVRISDNELKNELVRPPFIALWRFVRKMDKPESYKAMKSGDSGGIAGWQNTTSPNRASLHCLIREQLSSKLSPAKA